MPKLWATPIYKLPNEENQTILINVTNSVSAGLTAKGVINNVIADFNSHNVNTVLDFGAGALRHCFPLLNSKFMVCAVEFQEQFKKPMCKSALTRAEGYANFSKLIFPIDFISDKRKFDAVLLCFVLNIMPIPKEREKVVDYLYRKMNDDALLLYMAQWGQTKEINRTKTTSDGYYKGASRNSYMTFYKEMKTEDTHDFFKSKKLKRIKSYDAGGNTQVFLYKKEKKKWV
jgi:hypothetical protein